MSDTIDKFGDYIVFADESGDHSLSSINPIYPIFVLCFCLMRKEHYLNHIVPEVHKIKMKYFGHDQIIFHERDFVKRIGAFGALKAKDRENMISDINSLISSADIKIIAAVIDKEKLKRRYSSPFNPYHIGLQFCLERTCHFLHEQKANEGVTHIIAESRGKVEDRELKTEFTNIIEGRRNWSNRCIEYSSTPVELYCAPKGSNSSGVQLADLTARPIGLSCLRSGQSNRAFEIIKDKIWEVKQFP